MIVVEDGYFFDMPIKWLKEHDKQVREEVIDEFLEECASASYFPPLSECYIVEMQSVRKIAEQLKEQKNENNN